MKEQKKIYVSIGKETSEEELQIMKKSFEGNENICFEFDKNYIRCSEGELPWIIMLSGSVLLSLFNSGLYDLIKTGIQKMIKSPIKRRGSVVINYKKSMCVFSKNHTMIQTREKNIEFANIDDLFEYLKKDDEINHRP